MEPDLQQLRALSAAVSEGTLDAAARVLHVTPSAISQRIRALETATGRVLLVRSKPVRVTPSGRALLRLARQVELLVADAAAELADADGTEPFVTLPVAVNADSLATWVLPALAPVAGDLCFQLYCEDEGRTSELLREGTVVGAVTADAEPVAGCAIVALGAMRYRPMATPAFAARWFPDGLDAEALARAPVVNFDRDDRLQQRLLDRRASPGAVPPSHQVPSSADFHAAIGLGLGWGMALDLQSGEDERSGRLVALDPAETLDVPLYWQQWRLRSPPLDRLAAAVIGAARERLVPPTGGRR